MKKAIVFLFFLLLLPLFFYRNSSQPTKEEGAQVSEEESAVDVVQAVEIPEFYSPLSSGNFRIENNEVVEYVGGKKKIWTEDGFEKGQVGLSANGKLVGFYRYRPLEQDIMVDWEDDYVSLVILDTETGKQKVVHSHNVKIMDWHWLEDNEVFVEHDCGTECQYIVLINLVTGKKVNLWSGREYSWSPNKKFLLGQTWCLDYAVFVNNKQGEEIFRERRERGWCHGPLADKTQGVWSPDSEKLAVTITREDKDQLQLLVFDVTRSFKKILELDVPNDCCNIISWSEDTKVLKYDFGEEFLEVLIPKS